MYKKEFVSLCSLYTISPLHAGSGAATGAVDLPIQRERHTHWPHIQASAVKGAMREHFRNYAADVDSINFIFGSDIQDNHPGKNDGIPGAVSVSDAKLLAFPVRSNIAPFVCVTSPTVLQRLQTDLQLAGFSDTIEIPTLADLSSGIGINFNPAEGGFIAGGGDRMILEDAVIRMEGSAEIPFIQTHFSDVARLVMISDEMYDHIVTTCTEVQAQIKINHEKGTTENGSLRYEELLPSDSLLYTIVHYSKQNIINRYEDEGDIAKDSMKYDIQAEMIKDFIQGNIKAFIQIGGDQTLGRGICKVNWIEKERGK